VTGLVVESEGPLAAIGEVCRISSANRDAETLAEVASAFPTEDRLTRLLTAAERRRLACHDELRSFLTSAEFRRLGIDLACLAHAHHPPSSAAADESSPPLDEFATTVARAVVLGVRTLALEVTSKALAAGLARRWPPHVAVFTNLTRDHLDMHGSPEAYLAAKAQLFIALPPGGTAVLNADDESSALIREVIPSGVAVSQFSVRDPDATLAARAIELAPGAVRIALADSPLGSHAHRAVRDRGDPVAGHDRD